MNEQTMTRRGFVPYGPAGAGVEALARVMAADLADTPVTVNILLPGGATATGWFPTTSPRTCVSGYWTPRSWDRRSCGSAQIRPPGSAISGSSQPNSNPEAANSPAAARGAADRRPRTCVPSRGLDKNHVSLIVQPSLFGSVGDSGSQSRRCRRAPTAVRRRLGRLAAGFVTAADELFDALARVVPWHEEQMHIYDTTVPVPRLLARYAEGETLPHPVLHEARSALNAHYAQELGEPFVSAGLCTLYRDGSDSVLGAATASLARARATRWWRSFHSAPPGRSGSGARRAVWDSGSAWATGGCRDRRKLPADLAAQHPQGHRLSRCADKVTRNSAQTGATTSS